MANDKDLRSKNIIGGIGETYSQSIFLANGFSVYVPIVDNEGIDFIAVKKEIFYKVQVKTVQPYSYCYIRNSANNGFTITDDNFLVCYIRLIDISMEKKPEMHIFKASDWGCIEKKGLKSVLADYSSQKKNTEYGIFYNKVKGDDILKRYSADKFFEDLVKI